MITVAQTVNLLLVKGKGLPGTYMRDAVQRNRRPLSLKRHCDVTRALASLIINYIDIVTSLGRKQFSLQRDPYDPG